jgi:Arc/MetJ-type ribon-helix-helix transcriptional regulator
MAAFLFAQKAGFPSQTSMKHQGMRQMHPADRFPISFSMAMVARQISITLDEELLAFLDQSGSNRSAAIAEAVRQWRDHQWQRHLAEAYTALNEAETDPAQAIQPDALVAAREAATLSSLPA